MHAPLENGWYARDKTRRALANHFDLVLVDGPPREGRVGLLDNLDLFQDINLPLVIFDDVNRGLDRDVMILFCRKLKYSYEIIPGVKKAFGLCRKISTPDGQLQYFHRDVRKSINAFLSCIALEQLQPRCKHQGYVNIFSTCLYLGILKALSPEPISLRLNLENVIQKLTTRTPDHPAYAFAVPLTKRLHIRSMCWAALTYHKQNLRLAWWNKWLTICDGAGQSSTDKDDAVVGLIHIVNAHLGLSNRTALDLLRQIKEAAGQRYWPSSTFDVIKWALSQPLLKIIWVVGKY
jgi:hypothetical protein